MHNPVEQVEFTKRAALMGLVAYLVLAAIILL